MSDTQVEPEAVKAYRLLPGDLIRTQAESEEVVRSVIILVSLADGTSERYMADDFVTVLPPPERPTEEEPRAEHAIRPVVTPTTPAAPKIETAIDKP